jgi:hypothetical protein
MNDNIFYSKAVRNLDLQRHMFRTEPEFYLSREISSSFKVQHNVREFVVSDGAS